MLSGPGHRLRPQLRTVSVMGSVPPVQGPWLIRHLEEVVGWKGEDDGWESRVGTGVNKRLGEEGCRTFGVLQLARLDLFPSSLWAASTVGAPRAEVVRAEVDGLAAKRAAVVDKGLMLLNGHLDRCKRGLR